MGIWDKLIECISTDFDKNTGKYGHMLLTSITQRSVWNNKFYLFFHGLGLAEHAYLYIKHLEIEIHQVICAALFVLAFGV